MNQQILIGVDIGGTFTDAIAVSSEAIYVAKVSSNPTDPVQAVMAAIDALELPEPPSRFLHGSTLVTNMLLERKGAKTGFITNQGMRDVLHIGRHERPHTYAIHQEIPQQHHPPVPRKWRRTVAERLDADGSIVIPLDEEAVRQEVRYLLEQGVEAIAIGLLHAYRYPDHEERAARIAREESGDIFISTSSEVSPRFREYERFLTTAWNARVAPAATTYLEKLAGEIDRRWPGVPLTMMSSNGGLEEIDMSAEAQAGALRRTPIRLALSGPAAAGNAVARVAQDLDLINCVGLDVGGTSSDVVVVRDQRLHEAPHEERRVGGYTLQIPMLDLHTIGAGGGSLVSRDDFGTLHVGPQSAGARPGPACYNRGGTQPTVTDAAVVAGRLPDWVQLGGQFPIQADLSQQAFEEAFETSGEGVIRAALDVLSLAEANIAFAIRERTVARGLDPGELALVAAGGAGPLLACGIASMLNLAEVVVPPRPGLLAAWGLLVAPERRESAITILQPIKAVSPEQSEQYFEEAEARLSEQPPSEAQLIRTAALRYVGQGFEVEIPVEDPRDIDLMIERFHAAHKREYGFSIDHAPVEWIELRVAWEIPAPSWSFPQSTGANEQHKAGELWELHADEGSTVGTTLRQTEAAIMDRSDIPADSSLEGPAIIMETDTTIYVPTGWDLTSTANGYLRIRRHD